VPGPNGFIERIGRFPVQRHPRKRQAGSNTSFQAGQVRSGRISVIAPSLAPAWALCRSSGQRPGVGQSRHGIEVVGGWPAFRGSVPRGCCGYLQGCRSSALIAPASIVCSVGFREVVRKSHLSRKGQPADGTEGGGNWPALAVLAFDFGRRGYYRLLHSMWNCCGSKPRPPRPRLLIGSLTANEPANCPASSSEKACGFPGFAGMVHGLSRRRDR